jgi:hypothetical protein
VDLGVATDNFTVALLTFTIPVRQGNRIVGNRTGRADPADSDAA